MNEPIPTTESDYRGYVIEYAAYPAAKPGEWFGLYRVHKDGRKIFGADIVNPIESMPQAEGNARDKARAYVDELLEK